MTDRERPSFLSQYPEVLTTDEVATILRIDPRTIARQAGQGIIPGAVKIGSVWRFQTAALRRLFEAASPEHDDER